MYILFFRTSSWTLPGKVYLHQMEQVDAGRFLMLGGTVYNGDAATVQNIHIYTRSNSSGFSDKRIVLNQSCRSYTFNSPRLEHSRPHSSVRGRPQSQSRLRKGIAKAFFRCTYVKSIIYQGLLPLRGLHLHPDPRPEHVHGVFDVQRSRLNLVQPAIPLN